METAVGRGQIGPRDRGVAIACSLCGSPASFLAKHPEADLYRCCRCTHCFSHLESVEFEPYHENYFDDDHQRWFANPNITLFTRIADAIPQGASVLDAGCGRGDFLRHLRKIRPDLSLAGIDLAANRGGDGITFYQGDLLSMDINGQFDAIVSLAVIEHVADIRAFVDRLRQLTKPAGTVTVMTLNEDSLLYSLARLGKRWGIPLAFNRLYSRHHLHHFTRKSLRDVLQGGGFQIESEIVHNAPLAAIDIPVKSSAAEAVLRSGMWMVCKAGEVTGRSYLQTIFCRRPG